MTFSRFTKRVRRISVLEQHFHECATLEVGPVKPPVKDVEDSKEPLGRGPRMTLYALLQPSSSPLLLTLLKEGKHERLLRRVMQIQRPLGHTGAGDNSVHPDSANAVARKKLIGGVVDALASGCRLNRLTQSGVYSDHGK